MRRNRVATQKFQQDCHTRSIKHDFRPSLLNLESREARRESCYSINAAVSSTKRSSLFSILLPPQLDCVIVFFVQLSTCCLCCILYRNMSSQHLCILTINLRFVIITLIIFDFFGTPFQVYSISFCGVELFEHHNEDSNEISSTCISLCTGVHFSHVDAFKPFAK